MMIFMPVLAKWMVLSDIVTGCMAGGTVDDNGSVVAVGTIAGGTGLKYATIVEFSQMLCWGLLHLLFLSSGLTEKKAMAPHSAYPLELSGSVSQNLYWVLSRFTGVLFYPESGNRPISGESDQVIQHFLV